MKKKLWIVTTMICLAMVCVSCKKDKSVKTAESVQKTENTVKKQEKKVSFTKKVYSDESGFLTDVFFLDDEFLVQSILCASYSYDKQSNEITITAVNMVGRSLKYTYQPETDSIIDENGYERSFARLCTDEELESMKTLKEKYCGK